MIDPMEETETAEEYFSKVLEDSADITPNLPVYQTLNFKIPSPVGDVFVAVGEDRRRKPVLLIITIGKSGSEVQAWSNVFSRFATEMLESGKVEIHDIMQLLSSTTSDRSRQTKEGINVRSGPEAVYLALVKYQQERYKELSKSLGLADSPSFGE